MKETARTNPTQRAAPDFVINPTSACSCTIKIEGGEKPYIEGRKLYRLSIVYCAWHAAAGALTLGQIKAWWARKESETTEAAAEREQAAAAPGPADEPCTLLSVDEAEATMEPDEQNDDAPYDPGAEHYVRRQSS